MNEVTISMDKFVDLTATDLKVRIFLNMLFKNARLNYDKSDLFFPNTEEVLKAFAPEQYEETFRALKEMEA